MYICMPDGPVVHKEHGLICALCGDINPDERHNEKHQVLPCLEKALTARTYNRKYQLEKHLESHGVPKGSTVAKGWRRGYLGLWLLRCLLRKIYGTFPSYSYALRTWGRSQQLGCNERYTWVASTTKVA